MRICFLFNDLNTTAGLGRMISDIIQSLKDQGVEVEAMVRENGLLEKPVFNFFKIRKILKNCDVVHVFDVWPFGFLAAIYSIGLKKQIIITALGTYSVAPFYNFLTRTLSIYACRRASRLTAVSRYTAEEFNKILPHINVEVIPNGVDFDKWSRQAFVSDDIIKLKPFIVGVGGIKQRKGFHNSILAFAKIAKDFPNLKYIIAGQLGDEVYVNRLKEIVAQNNLEGRVIFLGRVDDNKLILIYQNAELFVLTPEEHNHHFEGFGLVYLEAAVNRLPSVGSRRSGAEEAIKEGMSGLLVNQGDVPGIAQALRKILGDAELKSKLSDSAFEWAKENTWQKVCAKYIKIYSALAITSQ